MNSFVTASVLALATLTATAQANPPCFYLAMLAPDQTLEDFITSRAAPLSFEEEMRDLKRDHRYRQRQKLAAQDAEDAQTAEPLSFEEEIRYLKRQRYHQAKAEVAQDTSGVVASLYWLRSQACLTPAT